MKYLLDWVVILSAVFIASSSAYNLGLHPALANIGIGANEVFKRQEGGNAGGSVEDQAGGLTDIIDIDQILRCARVLTEEQCTNGQLQAAIEVTVNCGDPLQVARLVQNNCRKNSAGNYCNLGDSFFLVYVQNLESVCRNSFTECSTECREQLIVARNMLGCCINIGLNDSSLGILYNPAPFNYSLWSRCNVEPVTEECTPSTINLPSMPGTTCTLASYLEQLTTIQCTRQYVDPVKKLLAATEGCDLFSQVTLEACGANQFGRYCSQERASSVIDTIAPSSLCTNNEMCTGECSASLQTLANKYGCCVNDLYNNSLAGVVVPRTDWLEFEFWTQCGVSTPGSCNARLNGVHPLSSTSSFTLASLVMVAMLWM